MVTLVLIICICLLSAISKSDIVIYESNGELFYRMADSDDLYRTWETDGAYDVYLPGYCNVGNITCCKGEMDLDKISVHKGSNIYTVDIRLDDGNEATAISDKEFLSGQIKVITGGGNVEFPSTKVTIKGRGNTTWDTDKQPYILRFDDEISIAGLNKGKKFVLLADHYEATKILNKLMFDLNREAGMNYNIGSEFCDLYINGVYRGIYTICEPVDHSPGKLGQKLQKINRRLIAENEIIERPDGMRAYDSTDVPDDITGAYIIEKDVMDYYGKDVGFIIDNYAFSVKYPNNLTITEAEMVKERFCVIDELLRKHDPKVFKYIDIDSFATRYLTEEFCFNSDAGVTSWYFYYRSGDPLLYAGPGWDYDGSFGESNGEFLNCNRSILEVDDIRHTGQMLMWDTYLLGIPEYRSYVADKYKEIRPIFVKLYKNKANGYINRVYDSVMMDRIRWSESESGFEQGQYNDYESTIKLLLYFIYHRIGFLDNMYLDTPIKLDEPAKRDVDHQVRFHYDNGEIVTVKVSDGEQLGEDDFHKPDAGEYWTDEDGKKMFSRYLPIYMDMDLFSNPEYP